jgi:hypothetical protein
MGDAVPRRTAKQAIQPLLRPSADNAERQRKHSSTDAHSAAKAQYVRSIATDMSLAWQARRFGNAVARQLGLAALRDLRERIAAGTQTPAGNNPGA